jgi:ATP-dependent Clp protease ATP-binding subunit ClpX
MGDSSSSAAPEPEASRRQAEAWLSVNVIPSPRAIRAALDEHVVAQERAKIELSVALYRHYQRRRYAQGAAARPEVSIQKSNIMLIGPTGTGKTELVRAMATTLQVPLHVVDATRLTAAGYVGDSVESVVWSLYTAAGRDLRRAEWGIVMLDEFDKLAGASGRSVSGHRDIGGIAVQQELLRMVEGARVPLRPPGGALVSSPFGEPEIDTTNILFICAGAFAGSIEEVVNRRVNRDARIGFGAGGSQRRELDGAAIYASACEEDLLDLGIIPEMVGRLPVLTATLPLTEDDMVRILTDPKDAIVKQYQALFAMDGVELVFDEAALRLIAREAMKRPTGARALRSILEGLLKGPTYEHAGDPTLRRVRITSEVVEKRSAAVIERAAVE